MKTFFVLSSLMFSVVLGAPSSDIIRKRDLQTIQNAFINSSTAASNLDVAIRALTSDPNSAAALAPAMAGLEGALAQGRDDVAKTQPLTITDAIGLQNSADTLTKSVKIMVMSTMLQRQTLDQLGATPMLLQSFMNQNMISAALGQNVLSKLPAEGLSSAMTAFAGAGGSVGMGIISLSNPPMAMPPGMGPPPMGMPMAGGQAAASQGMSTTGMSTPPATAASTNVTVSQVLEGKGERA